MTWYVCFVGRQPGVYSTWWECHQQVHKFPGANCSKFNDYGDAVAAYNSFMCSRLPNFQHQHRQPAVVGKVVRSVEVADSFRSKIDAKSLVIFVLLLMNVFLLYKVCNAAV